MLDKRYDFQDIETRLAAQWEKDGCYNSIGDGREPFVIMMPPPNVTGTLHLGHALDNTLPDILMRRARMQGKDAVYQPGTDHASIAVHVVLERQWAKDGKTRFDYGREAFMEKAWEWKDHSAGQITGQLRRLGISCDWQNERFTMDPGYVAAVNRAFVELYERGLIYRGQRLVNWDPKMQTAVSDLEVKHQEVQGHLWHVAYKFADGFTLEGQDAIEIATTRPETILGDGAVAIHPEDRRAKALVGRKVIVPIVEREVLIVADTMVDPEFGSGLVKITPAHDFNDFAFYQRHKDSVPVPLINLLTKDGRMNENCPAGYVGLDRFEARKQVVAELEAQGLLLKVEPHTHNVGHAERDNTVLEPYLTWQWYVSTQGMADKCLQAAEAGDVSFVNERDYKVFRHWLENIQDWCISRQLWWGHRIPAWYRGGGDGPEIYVGERAPGGEGWVQDDDILDTWFSSGLWPFATQGWPQGGERLQMYFAGEAIMPGRDLIFFWVIRMMMMSLELTGKVPFKTVFMHGMIVDENGQKMSKSKGNVTDPMDLIKDYGADALRFTMASICSSEDMRFHKGKVEQNRNFCTKLWNATRFMLMNDVRHSAEQEQAFIADKRLQTLQQPVNQWIVGSLKSAFEQVDRQLDAYEFAQAASTVYHFAWGVWCDWYLELTKPVFASGDADAIAETRAVMGWAYEKLLILIHPFMPFVSEELWQQVTLAEGGTYLMNRRWPQHRHWPQNEEARTQIDMLVELVGAIRQARTTYRVPVKAQIEMQMVGNEALPEMFGRLLSALAGVAKVSSRTSAPGKGEAAFVVRGMEFILPLVDLIDVAQERARLQQEIVKLQSEKAKIDALMSKPGFAERAPAEVVETQKRRTVEIDAQMKMAQDMLSGPYAVN